MDVKKAVMEFSRIQRDEAEKEKRKGKLVNIDPDSFVAKEILYQTAVLKKIEEDTAAIRLLLEKRQNEPAAENHSDIG